MARDSDRLAGSFESDNTGGLFADEKDFDRRSLWRLGGWGLAATGGIILAMMASQGQIGGRRDQVAAVELGRQAQQFQALAKESQSETRRLAAALETLNTDRDRLFARVTVLEQGLESVTGAVAKQSPAAPASAPPQTHAKVSDTQPPAAPAANH